MSESPVTDEREDVLGLLVDPIQPRQAVERILGLASAGVGAYVCFANVHMVMEARESEAFRACVNSADLVLPDGMPLVWFMRQAGRTVESRVSGPDTMWALCGAAARVGVPIGIYGGAPEVLEKLRARLTARFEGLEIAYAYSPPFRPLTDDERATVREDIIRSGARLVFIGLGCPKQETWMGEESGRLPVVLLGVGAAFDFFAGTRSRAPRWMQRSGLEWLHRLATDPRRLAPRYFNYNPRFMALAAGALMARRRSGR